MPKLLVFLFQILFHHIECAGKSGNKFPLLPKYRFLSTAFHMSQFGNQVLE